MRRAAPSGPSIRSKPRAIAVSRKTSDMIDEPIARRPTHPRQERQGPRRAQGSACGSQGEAARRSAPRRARWSPTRSRGRSTELTPDLHLAGRQGGRVHNATLDDVRARARGWPLLWLDCAGLANVDLIADIGRIFGLHPLALEDTVNTGQRPKVDFFDDHAFVVVSMIDDPAFGPLRADFRLLWRRLRHHLPGARGRSLRPGAQAHRRRCPIACAPARPTISPTR